MWTCSHSSVIDKTVDWFAGHCIYFDYANENPECTDTSHASFKEKPYCNVILDDKAGLEGNTDWFLIEKELDIIDGAAK